MKHFSHLLLIFLISSTNLFAQTDEGTINLLLNSSLNQFDLLPSDIEEWEITDRHISQQTRIEHIYLRQQFKGLSIYNANTSLHIQHNGALLKINNNFISNLNQSVPTVLTPQLSPEEIITKVAEQMRYEFDGSLEALSLVKPSNTKFSYIATSISKQNIPLELMLFLHEGTIRLVWNLSIQELEEQNWWSMRVDATTGEILEKNNWVVQCDHVEHDGHEKGMNCMVHQNKKTSTASTSSVLMGDTYNVFAQPLESPNHGERTIVTNPADVDASPLGWHDVNGIMGPEYTITRGNNAYVSEDHNGNNGFGASPDGGSTLNFDFPFNPIAHPHDNLAANLTDLFYWNNVIHDVMYQYGFDEQSGNFQQINYTNQGLEEDYVIVDAQDGGGTNNANFSTPPDGFNPRMQMYLWNGDKDSGLDHGIVAHEYGHGISNRLTGGGSNTDCLFNREQMGEGWSDYYSLMFTMEVGDQGTDATGVATYVRNEPVDGRGNRNFPYSTDMTVNPQTYEDIDNVSIPHGLGSIWCTMLWEMTWALIDKYGYDPDIYHGTGGNNIAMQLVTEALKLQPCSPGFVDGRDAILAADQALFGGANECDIWNAFAKRGLGFSASQGSANSTGDEVEAFDVPPGINSPCMSNPGIVLTINPFMGSICSNGERTYTITARGIHGYTGSVDLSTGNLPLGVSATIVPTTIATETGSATLTLTDQNGLSEGSYDFEINGISGVHTSTGLGVLKVLSDMPRVPAFLLPEDGFISVSNPILKWESISGASNYDIQIATDSDFNNIVDEVNNIRTNSYEIDFILSGEHYWRVRANNVCGTGDYSTTNRFTIQSCGGVFTDSGGIEDNYENGENIVTTICPDDPNTYIRATFTSFDVPAFDDLSVYNGTSTNGTYMGRFNGTGISNAPGEGTISSYHHTGCLTFSFYSNSFTNGNGWTADIDCIDCATPFISFVSTDQPFCEGSMDGKAILEVDYTSPLTFELTYSDGSTPETSTTGVFRNLGVGAYSVTAYPTDAPTCISNAFSFNLFPVNSNVLDNLSITGVNCDNGSDGSIIVNTDYPNVLQYTLTKPDNTTEVNTTGIFNNLMIGIYELSAIDQENNSCTSYSTPVTVESNDVKTPITTGYVVCEGEDVPLGRGLIADCNSVLSEEAFRITPSTPIGPADVCATFNVLGVTKDASDLVLDMKILHTRIGDVSATLTSPAGTEITLFQSRFCSQDNLEVTFWDDAMQTANTFANTCNNSFESSTNAKEGLFQPFDLFSAFNGEDPNGAWLLCFSDSNPSFGSGTLEEATLRFGLSTPTISWWDAPNGGNLLSTDNVFDPVGSGQVDNSTIGNYTFYAECIDPNTGCISARQAAEFSVQTNRVYVDEAAEGDNTGESWENAFNDLQVAIDYVRNSCINQEVWIAGGTYYPSSDQFGNIPSNIQFTTFFIDFDVKIYGGFAGNETSIDERICHQNPTILSGDHGVIGDKDDNSSNILAIGNVTSACVLDGITITESLSSAVNNEGSPFFRNCTFLKNNKDAIFGGVIDNNAGFDDIANPTFVNCSFRENTASNGGVIYSFGDGSTVQPVFINCEFIKNKASNGAILSLDDAAQGAPQFINCTFYNNFSNSGGLFDINFWDSGREPIGIYNSIIWGNSATSSTTIQNAFQMDYTLIQESTCPTGTVCTNMIYNTDPEFNNVGINDVSLSANSVCIDRGNNNADIDDNLGTQTMQSILTDLACNNRFFSSTGNFATTIDLGAYEYNQQILAVEWLNFTATKVNEKVQLQWEVADVTETQQFLIEYSTDAINWSSIGTENVKGLNYTYWHRQPLKGANYYRVKELAKSGETTVTPVRSIWITDLTTELQLYPNPTNDLIHLTGWEEATSSANIQIYNALGQRVKILQLTDLTQEIDLSDYVAGIYWIQVQVGEEEQQFKVVKQ